MIRLPILWLKKKNLMIYAKTTELFIFFRPEFAKLRYRF